MEIGLIEWYDDEKGFGVLKTPDNKEIFIHISNWKDKKKLSSTSNSPILFEIGFQRNKTTAINCIYFNPKNKKHWEKVFSLAEYDYTIKINYSQKNILNLVFSQLDEDFDFTIVQSLFFDHFADIDLFNRDEVVYHIYKNITNEQVKRKILELITTKVNQLNDLEIIKFWKKNIISEYFPKQDLLTRCHKEISISDLKNIENTETRNLIILKKLQSLNQDFNKDEYLDFGNILGLIDSESLKDKIVSDLNNLATSIYLDILTEDIIKLTKNDDTDYYSLKNFIEKLPDFLSNDFKDKLTTILNDKIVKYCSFRTITECWKKDLIKKVDDVILQNLNEQNNEDLTYFLNCEKCDEKTANTILDKFLEDQEYNLVLEQANNLGHKSLEKYDKLVWKSATEEQYFELWDNNKAFITPFEHIFKYLNHQENRYWKLKQWLSEGKISKEKATELLTKNIKETTVIDNRFNFYRVYYSVKYLLDLETNFNEIIEPIENDFVSLILWHFKKKDSFDFDTLKGKFIYFKPDDQVYIFKRLFYLKHKGKIDFDINKLDEIIRADLNLYLQNEEFSNDFLLDISTHIIIECIKSFVKKGNFVFKSDFILKDLQNHSKRKFKIAEYFDLCEGRLTADWDWHTNGEIEKIKMHSNGREYEFFKVSFEYDESIIEDIKKLPYKKRKYYPDGKYWGVSLSCKEGLFNIAKRHRLFINLPNNKHYDNNTHLAEFTRFKRDSKRLTKEKNIPNGITFCEGRKAKKEHNKFKREFWWCKNQECFQNCVTEHLSDDFTPAEEKDIWEEYTLLDFLRILNINVDEHKNNPSDYIKNGHYYKFLGHINAFNRLLEHLYCEECGNLLYPVNSSHFALYRDVRFHCIEDSCSQKHKEIYLNHCLYGECKAIIDSRISKRCEHGLYICSNCGTCCSEDFFRRRLNSLRKNGGYIHPELIKNVENKNGHLEKREYYCYKCSGMMTEMNEKKYKCFKCDITYDLEKFKWLDRKWTEISRRRKDYPVNSINNNDDNDDDFLF